MQICPDPLAVRRSVRSDHRRCVTLPACYPTIFPYIPNNVEYNEESVPNASTLDGTNIFDSSFCANSQLIQRLRYKLGLYETSSASNHIRQDQQHLTDTVKSHVSDWDRQDLINQSND